MTIGWMMMIKSLPPTPAEISTLLGPFAGRFERGILSHPECKITPQGLEGDIWKVSIPNGIYFLFQRKGNRIVG